MKQHLRDTIIWMARLAVGIWVGKLIGSSELVARWMERNGRYRQLA